MSGGPLKVLVVGATGTIGRRVVTEALQRGYRVRALVRDVQAANLPSDADLMQGDLTATQDLARALDGVDAVVMTHGSHGAAATAEAVDYGAVRNLLDALDGRSVRIALMTAIGVTKHSDGHDWKRRGERLVRASGLPYTIVRPGWFDLNQPNELQLQMLQGDRRWAGDPSDGVVSRAQISEVLVASLTSAAADHKTFELVAVAGPAPADLEPLFEDLDPDVPGVPDAVHDSSNMPLAHEPPAVQADLSQLGGAKPPVGE